MAAAPSTLSMARPSRSVPGAGDHAPTLLARPGSSSRPTGPDDLPRPETTGPDGRGAAAPERIPGPARRLLQCPRPIPRAPWTTPNVRPPTARPGNRRRGRRGVARAGSHRSCALDRASLDRLRPERDPGRNPTTDPAATDLPAPSEPDRSPTCTPNGVRNNHAGSEPQAERVDHHR